jgi:hypothetical protein
MSTTKARIAEVLEKRPWKKFHTIEGDLKHALQDHFGQRDFIMFHDFFFDLEYVREELLQWAKGDR